MELFNHHRCWLLLFGFHHCLWVGPLIWFAAYIQTLLLSDHVVAIYPSLIAWLCTCPLQWQRQCRCQPILQLHRTSISSSCHWQPTRKNCQRSLYDGASLIASKGGNTRGIWRPPCCGHQRSCCRSHQNRLTTDAYPWSVIPDGRKFWEWMEIAKV